MEKLIKFEIPVLVKSANSVERDELLTLGIEKEYNEYEELKVSESKNVWFYSINFLSDYILKDTTYTLIQSGGEEFISKLSKQEIHDIMVNSFNK